MTSKIKNKRIKFNTQPLMLKLLAVVFLFLFSNHQSFSFKNLSKNTISAQLQSNDSIINVDINTILKIQLSKADYNFMIGDKKDWQLGLKKVEFIEQFKGSYEEYGFEIEKTELKNTYINPKIFIDNNLENNNSLPFISYSDESKLSDDNKKQNSKVNQSKVNQLQNSEPIDYTNVIFSTYLGGGDYDYITSVATDKDSNLFAVGYTSSKNLPTTSGSYKKDSRISQFGESDIFISKFDKFGNLVTCTYFGSFVDDRATDIKINNSNEVLIIGYVHQTSTFPVTMNAYDTTANGFYDCFISKFDNGLTTLVASTLIGGRKDDYPMSLDIDDVNNVYITGYTTEITDSLFYPTTQSAYEKSYKGNYDVFVSKFNNELTVLMLSTLFGGNKDDFAQDIKVTPSGGVLVTGFTKSYIMPVTGDALQFQYNDTIDDSSKSDVFILKISSNFDVLLYSSYFGGKGRDGAYAIETDLNENIYIAGFTESENFPVTVGSYSEVNGLNNADKNSGDSFVIKLENSGRNLVYSTLFGGESNERCYDLKLNPINEVIAVGYTNSLDLPMGSSAFDKQIVGDNNSDGFIFKLNEDGSEVLFSSYYGGEENDICKSIVYWGIDNTNGYDILGLVGSTTSTNFIVSEFGFDKEYNDTAKTDAFVSLIKIKNNPIITYDYNLCIGNSVVLESDLLATLDTAKTYIYKWTPSTFLDFDNIAKPTCTPINNEFYTLTITDTSNIELKDTINVRVQSIPNPVITGSDAALKLASGSYSVNRNPKSIYTWFTQNATIVDGQGTHLVELTFADADTARIYVIETNSAGCSDTSDVFIISLFDITKPKVLILQGTVPRCSADTLILDAGPFFKNIVWSNGSTTQTINVTSAGKFSFKASNIIGDIVFSDTINVTSIQSPNKPQIRLTGKEYRCITTAKAYQWYYEGTLIPGATDRRYTSTQWGNHSVKITAENGCSAMSDNLTTSIENNLLVPEFKIVNYQDDLYFSIQNEYIGQIELKIYSILGEYVSKYTIHKQNEITETTIDISSLPKGAYFITLNYDQNSSQTNSNPNNSNTNRNLKFIKY